MIEDRSIFPRFGFFRRRSSGWLVLLAMMSLLATFAVLVWLVLRPLPPASSARSSDWVEVSRGEWLRAIRHVPSGRCFVRYGEGGLVETGVDVCRTAAAPAR
jgi:hypothetical protein